MISLEANVSERWKLKDGKIINTEDHGGKTPLLGFPVECGRISIRSVRRQIIELSGLIKDKNNLHQTIERWSEPYKFLQQC